MRRAETPKRDSSASTGYLASSAVDRVLTDGSVIKPEALPTTLRETPPEPLINEAPPANPALEIIERAYIEHVLRAEAGNKTRAAEVLGIDPSTLYRKIKRYDLEGA